MYHTILINAMYRLIVSLQHSLLYSHHFNSTCLLNRLIDFYKIIKKDIIGNFRYVELNTSFSGGYKRYNETIPKYLQDKPRQFLKHCLERITTAKDIRPEFIKDGEKRGEFVIQSTQTKNTWYNLSFGGTDGMPRCSCPDFSRTGFLCKHFFAVFEHRDDWKWDALPKSYRENPYLCLDDTIVFGTICEETDDPPYLDTHCEKENHSVQTPEKQITQEAAKCRKVLKQLSCLTYNIGDVRVLKELGSSLQALHGKFSSYQPTDDKVETTTFTEKKRKNEENVEKNQKRYLPLPVRRKKNPFTNRVASKPPSCLANILSMCR